MNDDETLEALDRRGREAGAALKERVAERPVPTFDPDVLRVPIDAPRANPGVGRRGLLAIAAVVLLVVGVGVALARTGSDDSSTPPATVPADELRRYLLGTPPEDAPLSFVTEDGVPTDESLTLLTIAGPMTVYGASVEDPGLGAVVLARDEDGPVLTVDELTPVEVGGRDAWEAPATYGDDALWVDVDGHRVLLFGGPGMVREAAAAVVVEDDVATLPDEALPEGWKSLGSVDESGDDGWIAVYHDASETGIQPYMVLSVMPGGRIDVTSLTLAGGEVRSVEVRGHPGVLVAQPATELSEPSVTVRWEERPGEVVELMAHSPEGVDPDEVLALVEDLVVVDADEAETLAARLRREVIEGSGATIVGEGVFADGSSWILATGVEAIDPWSLSVDGQVDPWNEIWSTSNVGPVGPDGGTPATEPGGAGPTGFTLDVRVGRMRSGRLAAYGAVTPDAVAVEVRTPDGGLLAEADLVTADGSIAGWVTELPDGVTIDDAAGPEIVVVALAADGSELGQLTF